MSKESATPKGKLTLDNIVMAVLRFIVIQVILGMVLGIGKYIIEVARLAITRRKELKKQKKINELMARMNVIEDKLENDFKHNNQILTKIEREDLFAERERLTEELRQEGVL